MDVFLVSNWDSVVTGAVLGSILLPFEAELNCFWILLVPRRVEEMRRRRWVNFWT
jgi:hypothetical protein